MNKNFSDFPENSKWGKILETLDFAFQPIVNIYTGVCYGFEALLRNYREAGFENIHDVFHAAFGEKVLFPFDLRLREKAISKFKRISFHERTKLFYNIDNRIMIMPDYSASKSNEVVAEFNLKAGSFCFELSEKNDIVLEDSKDIDAIKNILTLYKMDFHKIAIDDFGAGLSGLHLLYHSEPDYIKIDRFFISGIDRDSRKKLFVSSMLNMAHILGISVIAEGVETEGEFFVCKEIGCNLVQGYFVQRPTTDINDLKEKYSDISELNEMDKRESATDQKMIRGEMVYIEPIPLYKKENTLTDMATVFETFRRHKINSFFPLVNGNREPLGVIREKDLKEYVYSPYGKEILQNKSTGKLSNFISKLPVSEINTKLEKIIEIFSLDVHSEGILLIDNGSYIGFLSANSLIKLLNEKSVAEARDQSPLTRLPGNTSIIKYISMAIEDISDEHVFVYFDFNDFKPFNDCYGFRQGDRAIQLFADILKEISNQKKCFIGHIGGDDFFAAFKTSQTGIDDIETIIHWIIERFCSDVLSIYSQEDRARGFIISADRFGKEAYFPFLSVSAGALYIEQGKRNFTSDEMFTILAGLKKKAKQSEGKCILSGI